MRKYLKNMLSGARLNRKKIIHEETRRNTNKKLKSYLVFFFFRVFSCFFVDNLLCGFYAFLRLFSKTGF